MHVNRLALAIALGLALGGGCTVMIEEGMLFPPRARPLPAMSAEVTRRNLELTTPDGVVLRGWLLRPPVARRNLLFFYGNRSSLARSSWSLHWLAQALEANVVAFDYRGYGFSDGTPSVERIVEDALAVHRRALQALSGEGTALPFVVAGQSMGTASALHLAAKRRVDALVLLAPPASVEDALGAMRQAAPWYVRVEPGESLRRLQVSPLRDAALATARTLLVHGAADSIASPGSIDALQRAMSKAATRRCRVPGGHGDVQLESAPVRACVMRFLRPVAGSATRGGRAACARSAASPTQSRCE